jgi:hypothetical protein
VFTNPYSCYVVVGFFHCIKTSELILDPLYNFCCVIRRLFCLGYQAMRSVLSLRPGPRTLFVCYKKKKREGKDGVQSQMFNRLPWAQATDGTYRLCTPLSTLWWRRSYIARNWHSTSCSGLRIIKETRLPYKQRRVLSITHLTDEKKRGFPPLAKRAEKCLQPVQ